MGQYIQQCVYLPWKAPHFHTYKMQKPRALTTAGTYPPNLLSDDVILLLLQEMISYAVTPEEERIFGMYLIPYHQNTIRTESSWRSTSLSTGCAFQPNTSASHHCRLPARSWQLLICLQIYATGTSLSATQTPKVGLRSQAIKVKKKKKDTYLSQCLHCKLYKLLHKN